MTSLLALVLVALALAATLAPLRKRPGWLPRPGSRLRELEERYRASLADLADLELDREVGNLAEADYQALREQHRRRAAAALAQLTLEQEIRARLTASLNGVLAGPEGAASWGPAARSRARPEARPLRWALAAAAALALAAVAGIAVLYTSLVARQSVQEPLAQLEVAHAHTALVDSSGGFWVGHHDGLLYSADGRAWRPVGPRGDIMGIVPLPSGQGQLVVGHDVLLSSPDGTAWTPILHDLPGTDIHGADRAGDFVYAYVMGFGVFRTQDGAHWQPIGPGLSAGVTSLAALDGPLLFVAADGKAFRSPDGGRTWADSAGAGNLALSGSVRALAAEPSRQVLYAATSNGLYVSNPGATQWNRLPFRESAAAVAARGPIVVVVDDRGRFYLSRDGGVTWEGA